MTRLRHRRFFSLPDLNVAIAALLENLNNRPMRRIGKSRRQLFEEIERPALAPLPPVPFEYAEWKSAKVHPDYHVEVDKTFYSVPHQLIGRCVEVRLTHRMVEIFHAHQRVASHVRRSQRAALMTLTWCCCSVAVSPRPIFLLTILNRLNRDGRNRLPPFLPVE